jgi:uncharacterized protein YjbJ (UPF0337 family)
MTWMQRIRNAIRRLVGRTRVVVGRATGRRRTTMHGIADQRKADLRDDVATVKGMGRKATRRLRHLARR